MKLSRSLKYFLLGFLITAIAVLSISCDSGSKKKTATTRGGVSTTTGTGGGTVAGCESCSTSSIITTALGESLPGNPDQFQLALDFYYVNESQQVAAEGALFINHLTPFYSNFGQGCVFKAGNYAVKPIDGEYGVQTSSQAVQNLALQATDGDQTLRLRVVYASFNGVASSNIRSCDNEDYQDALLGTVLIESVNGVPCGSGQFTKTIYPTGSKNFNCDAY